MPSARYSQPLIYIDSDVYLDLVQRNETHQKGTTQPRWRQSKLLFDAVNADQIRLASSSLVEAEVCCNGDARKESERVRTLLRGWFTAPATVWTEIDRYLSRKAVEIMNMHRGKADGPKKMGPADAIHLAAAIRLGCDFLMTQDTGYPHGHKIEGVKVLRPDVVWQQTLWAVSDEATG